MADGKITIDVKTNPADLGDLLKDFNRQTKDAESNASGLGGALGKVAGVLGGVFALKGAFDFILDATRTTEDLTTQFIAFTGSAKGASDQLARLTEFAAASPFALEEVAAANRTLLAFGSTTKESIIQLGQLGEAAAATGANIGDLATIFGQIQAAGKLTGERFNQLVERGINIGPELAKTLGVAESALEGLRSAGKITSDDVAKAFANMTQEGGVFFGSTDRLSKTVSGSLSTLKDNITILASTIGSEGVPAFSKYINILSDVTNSLTGFLQARIKQANETGDAKRITELRGELEDLRDDLDSVEGKLKKGFSFFGDDKLTLQAEREAILSEYKKTNAEIIKLQQAQNEELAKQQIAAGEAESNKIAEKKKAEKLAQLQELANAELAAQDKLVKDRDAKILAADKQINALRQQEAVVQDLARQEREALGTEQAIQSLVEREAELTSQRLQAEASRAELLLQYDQAEILRATDKQKKLTDAAKKGEADRIAVIRKAQADEFNFALITSTAQRKFEEQTYAQRVATAQVGLNALASLTKSKSREAFEIGKAAATAQALVSIPLTAIEAYKSLAGIPFVGPGLGIAAAAAATAAGLSNLRQIQSQKFVGMNEGGVVPGLGNRDTVPALLTPGELVVPKKNFDDLAMDRGVNADQIQLLVKSNAIQARILDQLTVGLVNERLTTIITLLGDVSRGIGSIGAGGGFIPDFGLPATPDNVGAAIDENIRNSPSRSSSEAAVDRTAGRRVQNNAEDIR